VGVAAELGAQARVGGGGELGGHHRRAAAEEGERRGQHAAITDRDQLRDPVGVLGRERRQRITAGGRLPLPVARARHLAPPSLPVHGGAASAATVANSPCPGDDVIDGSTWQTQCPPRSNRIAKCFFRMDWPEGQSALLGTHEVE